MTIDLRSPNDEQDRTMPFAGAGSAATEPSQMGSQENPHRVPSLDGLRALSILLVILDHQSERIVGDHGLLSSLGQFLGPMGVRIFFVISGFIITLLLRDERRRNGSVSLKAFYMRRSLRIFPPCFVYVFFVVGLGLAGLVQPVQTRDLIAAMTYTVNYTDHVYWLLGHLWSLSVEEQFYLLWPIYFVAMSEKSGRRFLVGVIIVIPLIRLAGVAGLISNTRTPWAFHTVADALATGCLLALAATSDWMVRIRLAPTWVMTLILVAGISGSVTWSYLHHRSADPLAPTLANLAIAAFIANTTAPSTGFVFRFLNLGPLKQVGRWSYSMYLWQQPFTLSLPSARFYTQFPWNFLMLLLFTLGSYFLIEIPCLMLRRRLDPPKAKRTEPGTASKHGVPLSIV